MFSQLEQALNPKPAAVQQGDAAAMQKAVAQMQEQQRTQMAFQQFQQGLLKRLNPRIGTKDDTDPMVALMLKLKGSYGNLS